MLLAPQHFQISPPYSPSSAKASMAPKGKAAPSTGGKPPAKRAKNQQAVEEGAAGKAEQDEEKQREKDANDALAEYQASTTIGTAESSIPSTPSSSITKVVVPHSIFEADFKKLSIKDGPDEWIQGDEPRVIYNLTPQKTDWLSIPFGLETVPYSGTSPGFITGDVEEKTKSLNTKVNVTPELADLLHALDGSLQKVTKSKGAWNQMVSTDSRGAAQLKLKVYFLGAEPTAIKLLVVGADGQNKIEKGCGWSFLKPFAEEHQNFKWCRVKLTVTPMKVYAVKGKRGVTMKVSQLIVNCREKLVPTVEIADAFDDADLL